MSQNSLILKHLQDGNTLTPLEGLSLFGSLRLGARIKNIRDDGYKVITEMISQGGKTFARYSMPEAVKQKAINKECDLDYNERMKLDGLE